MPAENVDVSRRTGWLFFLIFCALAAGIVMAGYLSYQSFAQHYRSEIQRQLSAIAELKVAELVQWRKERLGDSLQVIKNPAFAVLVQRYLEEPEDTEVRRQLQTWLSQIQVYGQYDQLCLLDTNGVSRLAVPADRAALASSVLQRIPEVLRSGQVTLLDFYRNEHNQRVYLSALVPVLGERAGGTPFGVLVLRIDPEQYLYPFIKRWPTPSPTAETLLVRREGHEAVFLNELRFQTNTALKLRSPLDRVAMPAVQAALGREGVMEGTDYRGVPVLAATRNIPDAPWSMVARIDTAEAYGALHERLWQVIGMIATLLFGAGAGVGLLWRQQRVQFYRKQAASAEALRASEVRYRRLFEATRDGVLILDAETGMVVDVNPFLIELLGFSREDFLGKKIWELGFFKDVVTNEAKFAELQQQGYVRYEDLALEARDGQRHEVEFISNVYLVDQRKVIQCNIRDITARKQAEEALRENRAKLEAALSSMTDAVFISDAAGNFIEFNAAFATFHRFRDKAECARTFAAYPDLLEVYLASGELAPVDLWAVPRALRGETVTNAEYTLRRKDTGETWVGSYSFSPIRDKAGAIVGSVVVGRDITDLKRSERALRESEEHFRRAIVDAPFPIMLHAEDGTVLQLSKVWCETTGYTREELATVPDWTARAYGERKPLVQSEIEALYGMEQRKDEGDYSIRTKSGGLRIWNFSSAPLGRLPDGRRLVISMATDVTERRRAEEALHQEKEFVRALLDNIADGVVACDAHGHLVLFNRAAREWHGMDALALPPEAWGRHYDLYAADGVTPLPTEAIPLLRAFRGEAVREVGMTIVAKGQPPRHILASGSPFYDAQHRLLGAVAGMHDITARQRAEASALQSTRELQEKNAELERFLYTASHDLKSPVVTVRTFLGYLQQDLAAHKDDLITKDMHYIGAAADKMARLLDELLELSRIGRVVSPPVNIALRTLLDEALTAVAGRISERGVQTQMIGEDVTLCGDRLRLAEIWQNLVENAVKFMGDQPAPRIELGTEQRDTGRVFFVRDNGMGIDPRYQEKIFGLSEKLDTKVEGTGIGLAVVKRIVELYQGHIWVESAGPGQGACFYFTLPAALPEPKKGMHT